MHSNGAAIATGHPGTSAITAMATAEKHALIAVTMLGVNPSM